MITDQLADLVTRIRNAQKAGHPVVTVPASKTKQLVLKVLVDEGFIEAFEAAKDLEGKPVLKIFLRYHGNARAPIIREIKRLSRPGRRLYVKKDDIPVVRGGLGIVVVSTSRGMMSDRMARSQGLGGELVCSVF